MISYRSLLFIATAMNSKISHDIWVGRNVFWSSFYNYICSQVGRAAGALSDVLSDPFI